MLSWPARCACVGVLTAAPMAGAHGLRGEPRGPEAAAGPHDAAGLFDEFVELMKAGR